MWRGNNRTVEDTPLSLGRDRGRKGRTERSTDLLKSMVSFGASIGVMRERIIAVVPSLEILGGSDCKSKGGGKDRSEEGVRKARYKAGDLSVVYTHALVQASADGAQAMSMHTGIYHQTVKNMDIVTMKSPIGLWTDVLEPRV